MAWTHEQKIEALIRLPWTVVVGKEDGDFVARVQEIPGVIATGETIKAAAADLWQALRAVFECFLEFNDEIPLPAGAALPWVAADAPTPRPIPEQRRTVGRVGGEGWQKPTLASTASSSLTNVAIPV